MLLPAACADGKAVFVLGLFADAAASSGKGTSGPRALEYTFLNDWDACGVREVLTASPQPHGLKLAPTYIHGVFHTPSGQSGYGPSRNASIRLLCHPLDGWDLRGGVLLACTGREPLQVLRALYRTWSFLACVTFTMALLLGTIGASIITYTVLGVPLL